MGVRFPELIKLHHLERRLGRIRERRNNISDNKPPFFVVQGAVDFAALDSSVPLQVGFLADSLQVPWFY